MASLEPLEEPSAMQSRATTMEPNAVRNQHSVDSSLHAGLRATAALLSWSGLTGWGYRGESQLREKATRAFGRVAAAWGLDWRIHH